MIIQCEGDLESTGICLHPLHNYSARHFLLLQHRQLGWQIEDSLFPVSGGAVGACAEHHRLGQRELRVEVTHHGGQVTVGGDIEDKLASELCVSDSGRVDV